jgi:hypothetical protein
MSSTGSVSTAGCSSVADSSVGEPVSSCGVSAASSRDVVDASAPSAVESAADEADASDDEADASDHDLDAESDDDAEPDSVDSASATLA